MPPGPPETTRARSDVTPVRSSPGYAAQSPGSTYPRVWPPLAPALGYALTPLAEPNASAWTVVLPVGGGVPPSSLIRMLRNDTSSPVPWFWMPTCPASDRTGSVFVKSFMRTPLRNTWSRSDSTRIS